MSSRARSRSVAAAMVSSAVGPDDGASVGSASSPSGRASAVRSAGRRAGRPAARLPGARSIVNPNRALAEGRPRIGPGGDTREQVVEIRLHRPAGTSSECVKRSGHVEGGVLVAASNGQAVCDDRVGQRTRSAGRPGMLGPGNVEPGACRFGGAAQVTGAPAGLS